MGMGYVEKRQSVRAITKKTMLIGFTLGVNEGGYEKEARLGSSKYEVSVPLDKLYDMDGDPEGFGEESYKKAGSPYAHDDAAAFFEKMVKEAGYLGMWKDVGYKKHSVVAMLFTPHRSQVYSLL